MTTPNTSPITLLASYLKSKGDKFIIIDRNYNILLFNGNDNDFPCKTKLSTTKIIPNNCDLYNFLNSIKQDLKSKETLLYKPNEKLDLFYEIDFINNNNETITIIKSINKGTDYKKITFDKLQNDYLESIQNKSFLNSILDNSVFGIDITDETGVIKYVNDEFCKITGYTKEEAIGKHILEFSAEESLTKDIKIIKDKFKNNKINISNYKKQVYKKNGDRIWVKLSTKNIIDADGNFIGDLAIFENIDNFVKKEEKLKLEQLRFKNLFYNIPTPTYLVKKVDNIFILVDQNKEAVIFTSTPNKPGLGKPFGVKTDQFDKIQSLLHKVHNTKQSFISESWVNKENMTPKYFRTKISYHSEDEIIVNTIDLTSIKLLEDKLSLEKDKLSSFFNNANEAFFITKNRKIIDCNQASLTILGYDNKDQIIGMNPYTFSHEEQKGGESLKDAKKELNKLINLEGKCSFEWYHKTRTNKKILHNVSLTNLLINGETYTYIIWHDIENAKNFERKLEKEKNIAEESNLQKSAFLANMSHEIRTPMNAIIGFADLLKIEKEEEEKDNYIDLINSSAESLLTIINDIIDISKIEAKQIKFSKDTFKVNDFVNDIVNSTSILLQQKNKKNVDFFIDIDKQVLDYTINTDKQRVKQVIFNLITNSLKFTSTGNITLSIVKKDNLEFSIRDTGMGVEKDEVKSIFNRFEQSRKNIENKFGGTGLGLSISEGIITNLKGKIWCEYIEDGALFKFTLPKNIISKKEEIPLATDAPNIEEIPDFSDYTILLPEDEALNRLLFKTVLKPTNITVIWANDGVEALNAFNENIDKIDLILTDLSMPNMSGEELFDAINKIKPEVPFIAQSAHAFDEIKIKCFKQGFKDYITKPVKTEILFASLKKYLQK